MLKKSNIVQCPRPKVAPDPKSLKDVGDLFEVIFKKQFNEKTFVISKIW